MEIHEKLKQVIDKRIFPDELDTSMGNVFNYKMDLIKTNICGPIINKSDDVKSQMIDSHELLQRNGFKMHYAPGKEKTMFIP